MPQREKSHNRLTAKMQKAPKGAFCHYMECGIFMTAIAFVRHYPI